MQHPDRLILYQLIQLIGEICPKRKVENPFRQELELLDFLEVQDTLLLRDLLEAFVRLNAHSRTNDEGQLIATHSDLLNALQLVNPIDFKSVQVHEELLRHFGENPFSYLDAQVKLRLSKTTLKRRFKSLLIRKMLEQLPNPSMGKAQFRAIPLEQFTPTRDESIFEQMHEQWKDCRVF